MTTPVLGLDEIAESQASKYLTHNSALRSIEAQTIRVLDIVTAAPTTSPADGEAYIVGTGSTSGAWSTYTVDNIAYYNSGWYEGTPVEGLRLWVNDEDKEYVYESTAAGWTELSVLDPVVTRLKSTTANMQTTAVKTNLYSPPVAKKFIPTAVVVREPTASLAAGTGYNIGAGTSAQDWKTAVDLSALTGTDSVIVVTNDNAKFTVYTTADQFGIMPVTGAATTAVATIDIFGYVY